MTAPHGSRDGLAGRARTDDGDGDGDGGDDGDLAERGERGDEGPALEAMRSVWLTMRDEDPPERGLAELLAAARAKAETMQARPSLWQRLAAGLRRPPALALATVLVLVGGAVLLGRRDLGRRDLGRRDLDAPVPADTRAVPSGMAADPAVSATASVGSSADGSFARAQTAAIPAPADERAATKAGSRGSTATPEPAPKLEAAVRHLVTPAPVPDAPAAVAPAGEHRAADAAPVVPAGEVPGGFTGATVELPAPPPPAHVAQKPSPPMKAPSREVPASAPAPEGASASGDLAGTARASHNAPPADTNEVPRQAGKKAGNEATDDEATSLARDKSGPSPGASIDQLYKQCEAAARRGDCAAVRRLVMRITARDRGYRARLAQESPVGKCLADPAE